MEGVRPATTAEVVGEVKRLIARIPEIGRERLAMGWKPEIAWDEAVRAACAECPRGEPTVLMVSTAASEIAKTDADFRAWWNERFKAAPLYAGVRSPCHKKIGPLTALISAPWTPFLRDWDEGAH